jgi:hypothetical protein
MVVTVNRFRAKSIFTVGTLTRCVTFSGVAVSRLKVGVMLVMSGIIVG